MAACVASTHMSLPQRPRVRARAASCCANAPRAAAAAPAVVPPLPASGDLAPPPDIRAAVAAALWRGGLEPSGDWSAQQVEVDGVLPAGLRGTLYRLGPSRLRVGALRYAHWFDGDGGMFALHVDGAAGSAAASHRVVQTPRLAAQAAKGERGIAARGAFTQAAGGVLGNALRPVATACNVAPLLWAGKLLAASEGGAPFELHPTTLQTLGPVNAWLRGGALGFGAHFKIDAATGTLYNIGLLPTGGLRVFAMDADGAELRAARLPLPHSTFVHDFAQTARFLVFVIPPWHASRGDILRAVLGFAPVGAQFQWQPQRGTRCVVMRKADLRVVLDTTLADAFSLYHFVDAYEEDEEDEEAAAAAPRLRVRLCRLLGARSALEANFGDMYGAVWSRGHFSDLVELRIDLAAVSVQPPAPLAPAALPGEFPTISAAVPPGGRARYVYQPAFSGEQPGSWWDCIQKVDLATGAVTVRRFEHGDTPGEVSFVPDPRGDGGEDAGWLLCFVYRPERHGTDVLVLDARRMDAEPLATLRLPRHAPYAIHGVWHPDE